jgi:hypothetical protein
MSLHEHFGRTTSEGMAATRHTVGPAASTQAGDMVCIDVPGEGPYGFVLEPGTWSTIHPVCVKQRSVNIRMLGVLLNAWGSYEHAEHTATCRACNHMQSVQPHARDTHAYVFLVCKYARGVHYISEYSVLPVYRQIMTVKLR